MYSDKMSRRIFSSCRGILVKFEQKIGFVRVDLHGTTLSHATSLPKVYHMTYDHLHAHDIFIYKIKYT